MFPFFLFLVIQIYNIFIVKPNSKYFCLNLKGKKNILIY